MRIVFTRDVAKKHFVGITELEVWAKYPHTSDGSFEAEDATIVNSEIRASSSASSGSYVGKIEAANSSVLFEGIWSNSAANKTLRVYYNSITASSSLRLIVNNIETIEVNFSQTGTAAATFDSSKGYVDAAVHFLRGSNTLMFQHSRNTVELDKIKVIEP